MHWRTIACWTLVALTAAYGTNQWLKIHHPSLAIYYPNHPPRGYLWVGPLHPTSPLNDGKGTGSMDQLTIEMHTTVVGWNGNTATTMFEIDTPAARIKPDQKPVPPAFIIGVWLQPARSFAIWKARGINTMVGYESESNHTSIDDWTGTAAENGLFMIRQPHPHIQDDVEEPYLLAWLQADEPDIKKPPVDPAQLADLYDHCKKADPKRPVFLNISGGNVLFNKVPEKTYREYFKYADWIGNDFYPVTGWNKPDLLPKVGQLVDKLRDLSGGKPQLAFIETSDQKLSWVPRGTPGPTAAQVRAEIWDAVIHGARGIVYFPQQIGAGFQYDATPIDVNVEMSKQDQTLADVTEVLNTPTDPPGLRVETPTPIQATWRKSKDGSLYIFALNLSPQVQKEQTLTLHGLTAPTAQTYKETDRKVPIIDSKLTDDFQAYELHIYTIAAK